MEVCFYTEMGWTDGSEVSLEQVKQDMAGLETSLKAAYDNKVEECANWKQAGAR